MSFAQGKEKLSPLKQSLGSDKSNLRKLSSKKLRLGKKRLKDYGKVLLAKQLLRAVYNNPREKIFKKYFGKNKSINEVIGTLGSRLEIVLTAMGGAISPNHARQLINHGKISVNGHVVKQRGFLLKDGDIIASAVGFADVNTMTTQNISNYSSTQIEAEHVVPQKAVYGGKSSFELKNDRLRSSIIASIKPNKLPKFLNLRAPISATLLVNSDLSYGIFFSKAIKQSLHKVETTELNTDLKVREDRESSGKVGLGWKNTNVKAIKNLLLDMKTASDEEKLKLCAILYNLVQAYYSRVS